MSASRRCRLGGGWGGGGQLGPNLVPVVGAQILAGHGAGGEMFNRQAATYRHWADPFDPLPDQLWLRPNPAREHRLAAVTVQVVG